MRISDWSSDVCSSDLFGAGKLGEQAVADGFGGDAGTVGNVKHRSKLLHLPSSDPLQREFSFNGDARAHVLIGRASRSEEHTSELQSLMRTSYAVFCLKKKTNIRQAYTLEYTNS